MKKTIILTVCFLAIFLFPSLSHAMRCHGIAYFRHGQEVVIFRSSREGKNEKRLWADILFEDFTKTEKEWKKEHPTGKLARLHIKSFENQPTNFEIKCDSGQVSREVILWPAATYPTGKPMPLEYLGKSFLIWGPAYPLVDGAGFSCRGIIFYKERVVTSDGDGWEFGGWQARVLDGKNFVGPKSDAESQLEKLLRAAIPENSHISGPFPKCWPGNQPKPSESPLGWNGPVSKDW